jgi:hypothetical protein
MVAAQDFVGNTTADQIHDMTLAPSMRLRLAPVAEVAADRPLDAQFVLDCSLSGAEPEWRS